MNSFNPGFAGEKRVSRKERRERQEKISVIFSGYLELAPALLSPLNRLVILGNPIKNEGEPNRDF
jgi:hypothetical protein